MSRTALSLLLAGILAIVGAEASVLIINGSTNVAVDYESLNLTRPTKYVGLWRWDISSMPAGATILGVNMSLFESSCGLSVIPLDNDIQVYRINNQTFTFSGNTTWMWQNQMTNNTNDTIFNQSGSSGFTGNQSQCQYQIFNITEQFKTDYALGNTYLGIFLRDPDALWTGEVTKGDGTTITLGSSSSAVYYSYSVSNGSQKPYLTINYNAEADPPNITNIAPPNGTYINTSRNSSNLTSYTCQANDATMVKNVSFYTTIRGGAWGLRSTNTSNFTAANYTFNINHTAYQDAGMFCNLIGGPNSNGRSVSNNGTDWIVCSYQSDRCDAYQIGNCSNNRTILVTTPYGGWGYGQVWNGTHLLQGELMSKAIVVFNRSYNYTYNFTTTSCDASGLPYWVDWAVDGTVWVYLEDGGQDRICHLSYGGSNLTDGFLLGNSNSMGIVTNGTHFIELDTWPATKVATVYYKNGTRLYNFTVESIVGSATPVTSLSRFPYTDRSFDSLSVESDSPQEVTGIYKNTSGVMGWYCKACDSYGNCTIGANWTVNFTPSTPIVPNCTYSGTGDWYPSCDCNFTTAVNLASNQAFFKGPGRVTGLGNIKNATLIRLNESCNGTWSNISDPPGALASVTINYIFSRNISIQWNSTSQYPPYIINKMKVRVPISEICEGTDDEGGCQSDYDDIRVYEKNDSRDEYLIDYSFENVSWETGIGMDRAYVVWYTHSMPEDKLNHRFMDYEVFYGNMSATDESNTSYQEYVSLIGENETFTEWDVILNGSVLPNSATPSWNGIHNSIYGEEDASTCTSVIDSDYLLINDTSNDYFIGACYWNTTGLLNRTSGYVEFKIRGAEACDTQGDPPTSSCDIQQDFGFVQRAGTSPLSLNDLLFRNNGKFQFFNYNSTPYTPMFQNVTGQPGISPTAWRTVRLEWSNETEPTFKLYLDELKVANSTVAYNESTASYMANMLHMGAMADPGMGWMHIDYYYASHETLTNQSYSNYEGNNHTVSTYMLHPRYEPYDEGDWSDEGA